jgi:calcium/calmodulin-dependent protein kinase I
MRSSEYNTLKHKLRRFFRKSKTEFKYFLLVYIKKILITSFLCFVFFLIIFFLFFRASMDEEYYKFINDNVERCLKHKTRYEQNKEFSQIKSSLPLRPVKMTLTTAVFLITDDNPYTVLKRIIVNKKTPIYEDRIALKLDHPHLVKSYRSDVRSYKDANNQSQTLIWLYMEYLPIKITQSFVKRDEDIIRDIAYDMLLGLKYLHDRNIAHLDLKIANIMGYTVNNEIRYKIIDFGYSRLISSDMKINEIQIPKKNYGTFPYKPPEVVFKSIHGLKSDIWCVGAILLFLRIEHTPFYTSDNKKNKDLYERFLVGEYKIVYPSDISDDLKDFIRGCMRINRDKRPSVDDLLNHRLFSEDGIHFFEDIDSGYDTDFYDSTDEELDIKYL